MGYRATSSGVEMATPFGSLSLYIILTTVLYIPNTGIMNLLPQKISRFFSVHVVQSRTRNINNLQSQGLNWNLLLLEKTPTLYLGKLIIIKSTHYIEKDC